MIGDMRVLWKWVEMRWYAKNFYHYYFILLLLHPLINLVNVNKFWLSQLNILYIFFNELIWTSLELSFSNFSFKSVILTMQAQEKRLDDRASLSSFVFLELNFHKVKHDATQFNLINFNLVLVKVGHNIS